MVTGPWQAFGASVRGPGHFRENRPNQDAYRIARRAWGDVAVVSDGVGSLPTSEHGSAAACRAVVSACRTWNPARDGTTVLFGLIHREWLSRVAPFAPAESAATCLFAFRPADGGPIVLGMLGDGLVAALGKDGTYLELCEDKNDWFSNQTEALSENTQPERWRTASVRQEDCTGLLLCTDGVADDLIPSAREGVVRHICGQAATRSVPAAARALRKMLENWPVPKHSDDKTMACMFPSGRTT